MNRTKAVTKLWHAWLHANARTTFARRNRTKLQKKDDGHVKKEAKNGSQESKESFRHEIYTSAANAKRIAINYYGAGEDYMRSKGVDYMRFNRLEQNHKAARESCRRKKAMIEEL